MRLVMAREEDVGLVLSFIRKLAEYEKMSHEVTATEEGLREALFGRRPVAEAVLGYAMDDWTVMRITGEALERLAGV